MRRIGAVFLFLIVTAGARLGHASTSASPVYNVVDDYGAYANYTNCASTTSAIQSAMDDASTAGGGVVYFPPGSYCVNAELLGHPYITLRGSAMAGVNAGSPSVIVTSTDFAAGKAVIRMADRTVDNYGFSIEDLSVYVNSTSSDIVGVDFSGVWYGAIRGVAVGGTLIASPRSVGSVGSVGFLFSDLDGANPGHACFGNLIERTSVMQMDTAYKFFTTQGNEALNTLTNFWVSEVNTGIWMGGSGGNIGLTFRDGYMSTGLAGEGKKSFKTSSDSLLDMVNVTWEGFDQNDLNVTPGETLFGNSVWVEGALVEGVLSPLVYPAQADNCGAHSSCPCRPGTIAPPSSTSFWATIPAGTSLSASANTFTYYTYYDVNQTDPVPDLYFTFHPTHTANVNQFFQMTATNTVTTPMYYTSQWETYNVTLFLTSAVTLDTDFIFFLEANFTTPGATPGTCGHPPTL